MPSVLRAILDALEGRGEQPEIELKAPTDIDFRKMVATRRKQFASLTRKLSKGDLDPYEWAAFMEAILFDGHTNAALLGRRLAKQKWVRAALIDMARGQAATDAEHVHLHGFLEALSAKDPRYWDESTKSWIEPAILDRQTLYLGKMRGTANQAFIAETPADSLVHWRLGGSEDHCAHCPEYAALSPFEKSELPTWPGDNDTPCRFNCLCYIEIDDITGFAPVRF